MQYDVKTLTVAAVPLLVVRRRAAQSQLSVVVPQLCGEAWNYIRAAHVPSPGRNVAVYLNGTIDLEVGVEVDSTADGAGDIVRSATPAGRVATATHFGSYARLAEANQGILEWCRVNSLKPSGPSWEVYGHWTDDQEKVQTDIFYLLAGNP